MLQFFTPDMNLGLLIGAYFGIQIGIIITAIPLVFFERSPR